MYKLSMLFILFLIYSIIGWIIETIFCSIEQKKLADRGFLIGPICPIYGFGGTFMTLLLTKYLDDPLALFIMAVVICSILECLTSYFMEKLFNTRWWDYSDKRFNINGRVCLSVAACFGFLGVILLYFVNPFLVSLLSKIPDNILIIISIILFILLIFDFIISMVIVGKFTKDAKLVKEDSSNDINSKIREYLINKSTWFKRLVKAFPDFKYLKK